MSPDLRHSAVAADRSRSGCSGLAMRLRRSLSALLFACAMPASLPALADDIVLGLTRGDVQILSAGQARPSAARKGSAVKGGDRVYTGRNGWTVLQIPDGSRIVLTANSEFLVQSHDARKRAGTFALLTGMLRALITPSRKEAPDYSFGTLTAVAGVRGTDFTMLNRGQANVFFGNTGVVEVAGMQNPTLTSSQTPTRTASRNLTANTVVQTTRGLTPTQPVAVAAHTPLAEIQKLLTAFTDETPPAWEQDGRLPEIMARWNIGYSRFLADAGREEEALYALQLAQDLSDDRDIQADARLERGVVFSRNPGGASAALLEYEPLLQPDFSGAQRESALYLSGMAHLQLRQTVSAQQRLQQYLRDYPQGRYANRVMTLLRSLAEQ
jgi:hypothetical protein